jgi:hypothetical protein
VPHHPSPSICHRTAHRRPSPLCSWSIAAALTPSLTVKEPLRALPLRRIPTVGIVRKVMSTRTQLTHKHHHHGGAVCPSYGVVSLDTPDRTRATPFRRGSERVVQEGFSLV